MQLNEAVSRRLVELMQERGMTQYQLYMKSGVPKSTIGNLVNCAYPSMKLRIIHELCQGLEIDLSSFFAALYAFSQSVDRISSQQHRKGHVLPDAGRYALQRAGGRERNPVCLLPCHSHCRSPVPQSHDGQAFSE